MHNYSYVVPYCVHRERERERERVRHERKAGEAKALDIHPDTSPVKTRRGDFACMHAMLRP